MIAQRKPQPYTADELRDQIYAMNVFLTSASQSRLSLETLPDGSNQLIVAASYNLDNASVTSAVMNLMQKVKSIDFLCKTIDESECEEYGGCTILTCAAENETQALQTIFNCVSDVVKTDYEAQRTKLANFTLTGRSLIHFAAAGGARRNLELLVKYGVDLTLKVTDEYKSDKSRVRAGWNVLDIAIEKWSQPGAQTEKNVFIDVMNYFVTYCRENTKMSLTSIINDVKTKHKSSLSFKEFDELEKAIRHAHANVKYTQLSQSLTLEKKGKRRLDTDVEEKTSKKEKKLKEKSVSELSSHASATLSLSLTRDKNEANEIKEEKKETPSELEIENLKLKKELMTLKQKLSETEVKMSEKDKKITLLSSELHKTRYEVTQKEDLLLAAEQANLALRTQLNEKEKDVLMSEEELGQASSAYQQLAEHAISLSPFSGLDHDDDAHMSLSPRKT